MTTVAETGARRGPRTRSDALRNRERIVAAALEIFVEFGPDAPFDEIARRAGIGNATLYRHFADRHALIHDVLLSVMTRTADHAEAAAARATAPFTALCRFAHAAADERVGALCGTLVGGVDPHAPDLNAQRARLEDAVERLMDRARRAGELRHDVTVRDLMIGLSQLTRPLPGTDCAGSDSDAHRHLQLFLDGLQSPVPSIRSGRSGRSGRTGPTGPAGRTGPTGTTTTV
ncbi:TetR/AcrR family transcriptional regulator [Streptomyces sp. NBC_01476]|uniref:TetR/AcrR family transcriptional regulator n=1 Tax=Streptomyces sp. NBC_01476 TaxID=2903881 RepID=UPI002E2F6ADB|nr:TetR/AcrR family transcriptional regulator [Streptomyces sp. NBC_01476]